MCEYYGNFNVPVKYSNACSNIGINIFENCIETYLYLLSSVTIFQI